MQLHKWVKTEFVQEWTGLKSRWSVKCAVEAGTVVDSLERALSLSIVYMYI